MPWSLQYGAMLHLQVMQEKQQQWTNDKLTHLSFFVYYKKNFFVSFCSFFSQKNTLIIIMIINIFIFNHRFTDCFLSFFLSFFRSWCTLIICCLGWNQETKGKRWVSLDASFSRSRCWGLDRSRQASKRYYHVSVLNFNSSLNHKTLYVHSITVTDKDHMTPFLDFDDVIKSFNQSFYDPSLFCFDFDWEPSAEFHNKNKHMRRFSVCFN